MLMNTGITITSHQLDETIRSTQKQLFTDMVKQGWWVREREVVSFYVMEYLLPAWHKMGLHPTQIGIEVAVPQVFSKRKKPHKDVCKDIVLWPYPFMTCWAKDGSVTNFPMTVLEWTVINKIDKDVSKKKCKFKCDIHWLAEMAKHQHKDGKDFSGYAIFIDQKSYPITLRCTRVCATSIDAHWLDLK